MILDVHSLSGMNPFAALSAIRRLCSKNSSSYQSWHLSIMLLALPLPSHLWQERQDTGNILRRKDDDLSCLRPDSPCANIHLLLFSMTRLSLNCARSNMRATTTVAMSSAYPTKYISGISTRNRLSIVRNCVSQHTYLVPHPMTSLIHDVRHATSHRESV